MHCGHSVMAMLAPPARLPHWKTAVIELKIPDTAHAIAVGFALAGNGAAWFGDVVLEFG